MSKDRLLSDKELLAELMFGKKTYTGYTSGEDFSVNGFLSRESAEKLLDLINTQKHLYAVSELEKFKAKNHIGYAYEPGEVTENYIVLERVVKKGKNWVLRVQCRWCGKEMNRMTNKFNTKHIDCKEWGVHMRLLAEQRARIK